MFTTSIVVADASHARFFVHERTASADGVGDQIHERPHLLNPGREGSDGHTHEHDEKFARLIAADFAQHVSGARRLIICASPRMLGSLREAGIGHAREGVEIHELAHDLVKLTPKDLCVQLTAYGVMPASHPTVTAS